MRILSFLTPFIILLSLSTQASQQGDDIDTSKYNDKYKMGYDTDQSPLAKLLEVPEVKKQYDLCEKANVKMENMDNCIWDGHASVPPLDPKVKELVTQEFEKSKPKNKNKKGGTYEAISVGRGKMTSDPAIRKIQDYLSKKLSETLFFGDDPSGQKKSQAVDHAVFNRLYKSSVGKNIILTLSSYCIDADPAQFFIIDTSKRQSNITRLSTATANSLQAADDWTKCITAIQHHCYRPAEKLITIPGATGANAGPFTYTEALDSEGASSVLTPTAPGATTKKIVEDKLDETYKRACEVTNYLKVAKQNIKGIDAIANQYKKLSKSNAFGAGKVYDGTKKGTSVDDLTSLTSGEAINKSGYRDELEKQKQKLKECYHNGAIQDPEKCKDYYMEDDSKLKAQLTEASLRTRVIEENIKNINSEDEIRAYLAEQGYDDEQIEAELSIGEAKIKQRIKDRYAKERKALIANMADKMEKASVKKLDPSNPNSGLDPADIKSKVQDYEKKLNKQMKKHAGLIHFNNIVSGYLEIDNGGKESTRNTANVNRELGDYWEVTKDTPESATLEKLKGEVAKTGIDESRKPSSKGDPDSNESTSLGVKQINQHLINISTEQEKAKK